MAENQTALLRTELEAWDEKSKDVISAIHERHCGDADFLSDVVALMGEEPVQRGATWLLKRHFDNGGRPLNEAIVAAIYAASPGLVHWEAKLHVLQCMERMPIPQTQLPQAEIFLRACLVDEAKFVRAWAYSGFHEMAVQYPGFRSEASELLAQALSTETAGSVLARIRRKTKQGFRPA